MIVFFITCVETHQNDAYVGIYHFELQVGEVEEHEKLMRKSNLIFFLNK